MIQPVKFRKVLGELPQLIFHDDRDKLPTDVFCCVIDWLLQTSYKHCTLALREISIADDFVGLATWKRRRLKVKAATDVYYFYDAAIGKGPIKHQVLGALRRIEKAGESIFEQPVPKCNRGRPLYYWELDEEIRATISRTFPSAFYCPTTRDLFPEDYDVNAHVAEARAEFEAKRSQAPQADEDLDSEFLDVDSAPVSTSGANVCPEEFFLKQLPEPKETMESLRALQTEHSIREDSFEPVAGLRFQVVTVGDGTNKYSSSIIRPDGAVVPDYGRESETKEQALQAHNALILFVRENVRKYGYSTGRL